MIGRTLNSILLRLKKKMMTGPLGLLRCPMPMSTQTNRSLLYTSSAINLPLRQAAKSLKASRRTRHTRPEAPAAADHIHTGWPKGRSSSAPCRTNPICDGSLSLNNPSQQSIQDVPTAPSPPSRKRSSPPTGPLEPSPKRPRRSARVAAQKARETDSHKEELRHAFPRHCRDREWDVENLRIVKEDDGSLKCELQWAPTTVLVSTLKGELLE